jgi:hypothetical protein
MDEGNYPEDAPESYQAAPKASPLPWVLFGLTVLLAAVIAVVLMIKVDAEKSRTLTAEREAEEAKGHVAVIDGKLKDLQGQVDSLLSEKASLINERDALSAKLQTATGPKGATKTTAAATAPKKKTKGKKHH